MIRYVKNPDSKAKRHNYNVEEAKKKKHYGDMVRNERKDDVQEHWNKKPYYLESER